MDNRQAEYLRGMYDRIKSKCVTWKQATEEFNTVFNTNINSEPLRNRVRRLKKHWESSNDKVKMDSNEKKYDLPPEVTKFNDDGSIEAKKVVTLSKELLGDRNAMLDYLGYDHNVWEFVFIQTSIWEQQSNKTGLSNLYAVKYRVRQKDLPSMKFFADVAKEFFSKSDIPAAPAIIAKEETQCNYDLLMEIPPIELHLGKMSQDIDTGENYDYKIAGERFRHIINTVLKRQSLLKCGRCLLVIGSDFFNSESDGATSTHKIPQNNDILYKKMFVEGLRLYTNAIKLLSKVFPLVDVILCAGNHARAMEFFLYVSLKEHFRDMDYISFSDNFRDTQAYEFGKCAIFFNHGDANLKMTISSIPSEFPEIWGRALYRELHMGHLHKEMTVDDNGGMITRRIGSPCGTDIWHYQNRFIGATKKHQVFVWDAHTGLDEIFYINNKG